MTNDRIRNNHNRKSKRVILVAFEGKNKTERNYIINFSGREKNYVIKIATGNVTDRVNLVKHTIQNIKKLSLNLSEDDRAFCIFDTDINQNKNLQIIEAIKLADENKICIVTSCPCIEFWFLLHFEYSTSSLTNISVMAKLKKYIFNYEKNINIYPIIFDKTKTAINNAKKIEKYQIKENKNIKLTESNPHTEIYKIIEEFER